ncbi:MAG: hypothetical protein J5I41_02975 [Saprospiraceae bacterium]|nr:hypothetical protein [Saprospiraceae bacterium]
MLKVPTLFLFMALAGAFLHPVYGQCDLQPTLEGNPVLCPFESGQLSTQSFDTYQWYRIAWGGSEAEPISGAMDSFLIITESDILSRVFVTVTSDTCTANSDTVLVDGWAFLLPVVQHTGEYQFDPVEEHFIVCLGDTMFLELQLPYTVNITWYRDGVPLEGVNGTILAVTEEGGYTVSGAPEVCPNYIQPLGLVLDVVTEDCHSATDPEVPGEGWTLYPNPSTGHFRVEGPGMPLEGAWALYDALGRQIWRSQASGEDLVLGDNVFLPSGMYHMTWLGRDGQRWQQRVVVARP